MSNHIWVQEHVAAYLAGGLDAQEAERLEAHARECAECAEVVADARRLDAGLSALFADAHPDSRLEDRTLAKLRSEPQQSGPILNRWAKLAIALAAMLLLGVVGAVADRFMEKNADRAHAGSPE